MAGEVAFFELGVEDAQRGRAFYGAMFGVEGDADSQERFSRFKLCRDDQGSPFGLHERPRAN